MSVDVVETNDLDVVVEETNDESVEETNDLPTFITAYGASVIINNILVELGIEKVLPPQMFYNYTKGQVKKNKNPMIPFDTETGRINQDDLYDWFTHKYLPKNHPDFVEKYNVK